MSPIYLIMAIVLQTDSGAASDPGMSWLRLVGLVAVTATTIVIFALIFRPITRTDNGDSVALDADPGDAYAEWDASTSGAGSGTGGSLLQFPNRGIDDKASGYSASGAAAERLRRLTGRTLGDFPERRRLGARRSDVNGPGGDPVQLADRRRQQTGRTASETAGSEGTNHVGMPDTSEGVLETLSPAMKQDETILIHEDSGNVMARSESDLPGEDSPPSGENSSAGTESDQVEAGLLQTPAESDTVNEAGRDEPTMETWDALEGVALGIPVGGSEETPATLYDTHDSESLDLLGDMVNRQPSAVDQPIIEADEDQTLAPFITGEVPTAQEVELMELAQATSGKIVQFVPRAIPPVDETPVDDGYQILEELERTAEVQADPASSNVTRIPVDTTTREAITSTVQELLFCANVGEFMHGFALYTDRFLIQYMTDSGMDEDTFLETFRAIPAKEPGEWTHVDAVTSVERRDDGRISALVRFRDGETLNGTEQFLFRIDHRTQRWLIDDIQAI